MSIRKASRQEVRSDICHILRVLLRIPAHLVFYFHYLHTHYIKLLTSMLMSIYVRMFLSSFGPLCFCCFIRHVLLLLVLILILCLCCASLFLLLLLLLSLAVSPPSPSSPPSPASPPSPPSPPSPGSVPPPPPDGRRTTNQ